MRPAAHSPNTLRTVVLLALGFLAACGSSRKVADDRPLCQRCHGGASGNAAPPSSPSGATTTTDLSVGAHQAHLVAGRLRGPIACGECHVVPADMPAHDAEIAKIAAGTAQRVVFGPLGSKDTTTAAWDRTTAKCTNTYCHGATLNHGGTNHQPTWTSVDAGHTEAACGTCHFQAGDPFPTNHPTGNSDCNGCHAETVLPGNTVINIAGGKHMDGHIDGGCTACHGDPPSTGAHPKHASALAAAYGSVTMTADVASPTATGYAFGCGNCHPLDFAAHAVHTSVTPSTVPIVDLSPGGAPGGTLRARNDAAAGYDSLSKTCSGVYCHSSGQAVPAFATSPAWDGAAVPAAERCGKCHGNPPNYASGGAGAANANSHIGLLNDGGLTYETGHFAGFPSALHEGSWHGTGAKDSSPTTCQSCHYRTADATNTAAGGFYYLDTTGNYDLGGTGNFCFNGEVPPCTTPSYACTQCHDGTTVPQGTGKVVPYYHVNGTRDVDLDPRTTGPAPHPRPYWYGPYGASAPTSYWAIGTDAVDDTANKYLSFDLQSASWNASTKTCSSVACHFNRTSVQWGEPLSNGGAPVGTCSVCHNL